MSARTTADELFPLFFGGVAGDGGARLVGRGLLVVLEQIEHLPGIGAQKSGDEHDDQRADAAADGDAGGNASPVLNVVAPTSVLPAHDDFSRKSRR